MDTKLHIRKVLCNTKYCLAQGIFYEQVLYLDEMP
jgi:hypothetical protein